MEILLIATSTMVLITQNQLVQCLPILASVTRSTGQHRRLASSAASLKEVAHLVTSVVHLEIVAIAMKTFQQSCVVSCHFF